MISSIRYIQYYNKKTNLIWLLMCQHLQRLHSNVKKHHLEQLANHSHLQLHLISVRFDFVAACMLSQD